MPNRLAAETSPYLLQHANNPVDWQPWDDQALALARQTQKPILLSIGYSACHWCHVMAHESFEDTATAQVMNQHFVNIKVDREERPDLDKVYQLAHQLLTQQTGGWPLTMFLDPDTLVPFFGGTYFPRTPRQQLPGFTDLMLRIADVFATKRDELTEQGARVTEILAGLNETPDSQDGLDDHALLQAARDQLGRQYDSAEGGFGQAPKFPMPSTVERLLRHWAFHENRARHSEPGASTAKGGRDREALDMVLTTLTRMARGGIYDHLGGGFCRYATDRKWMIPHFEKMLYDNGQLLGLYADALSLTGDELMTQAVAETAGWLLREMRHPRGGFYAALDADSEGEEGRFYVWRRDQVKKLLTEDEYLVVETLYGLDKPANFEGRWNLHRYDAWRSVVERLYMDRDVADAALASARAKLLAERGRRVRPGRDEKVLTAWNGLTIKGLAKAGMRLHQPAWIQAAGECADFLRSELWRDGVLFATWTGGKVRYAGYLDDYANLLESLLVLLQARWRDEDARFAVALADGLLERFFDDTSGGFFFTAHDQEPLIHRPKPTMEDALPPGNGVACQALLGMGHLFGDSRYLTAVDRTLRWARASMARYPAGHATLLSALEAELAGLEQIIIRGPEQELAAWRQVVPATYNPWRHCYAIAYEGNRVLPGYLPKLVSSELRQRTVAYRCRGMACSLPIESPEALLEALTL